MVETDLTAVREKYQIGSVTELILKTEVNLIKVPPESMTLRKKRETVVKNVIPGSCTDKLKQEVTLITTPPQLKTVPTPKPEVVNYNLYDNEGFQGDINSGEEDNVQEEFIQMIQNTQPVKTEVDQPKRYVCDQCDKSYSRRQSLKEHMKLKHLKRPTESENPFKCDQCPKSFLLKKTLRTHKVVHLPPEKKIYYPCPYCDKK